LKRAVIRIDNDFWKRHQEEKHKFQAARSMQSYLPKLPRPTQRRPSPAQDGLMPSDKAPRDHVQGSSPQTSFPSRVEPSLSTTVSFLGPDGRLTPAECQRHMNMGLCICCSQLGHLARSCPKQMNRSLGGINTRASHVDYSTDPLGLPKNNAAVTSYPGESTA